MSSKVKSPRKSPGKGKQKEIHKNQSTDNTQSVISLFQKQIDKQNSPQKSKYFTNEPESESQTRCQKDVNKTEVATLPRRLSSRLSLKRKKTYVDDEAEDRKTGPETDASSEESSEFSLKKRKSLASDDFDKNKSSNNSYEKFNIKQSSAAISMKVVPENNTEVICLDSSNEDIFAEEVSDEKKAENKSKFENKTSKRCDETVPVKTFSLFNSKLSRKDKTKSLSKRDSSDGNALNKTKLSKADSRSVKTDTCTDVKQIKTSDISKEKVQTSKDKKDSATRHLSHGSDLSNQEIVSDTKGSELEPSSECSKQIESVKIQNSSEIVGTSSVDENESVPDIIEEPESLSGKSTEKDHEDDVEPEEVEYRIPYYLENFTIILENVLNDEHYLPLFNEEDMRTIENYKKVSEPAQKLFIRLFGRQFRWVRADRIKYPKIADDLADVLKELVQAKLLLDGKHAIIIYWIVNK